MSIKIRELDEPPFIIADWNFYSGYTPVKPFDFHYVFVQDYIGHCMLISGAFCLLLRAMPPEDRAEMIRRLLVRGIGRMHRVINDFSEYDGNYDDNGERIWREGYNHKKSWVGTEQYNEFLKTIKIQVFAVDKYIEEWEKVSRLVAE
jgi:hypothetical protein